MEFIIWLTAGAMTGYIANAATEAEAPEALLNLAVAIVGAFLGHTLLLPFFLDELSTSPDLVLALSLSLAGAALLLVVVSFSARYRTR